ncbi:MAG: hypothetical protein U0031_20710 [Thermomicrobiales bacterium]
MTVRIVAIVLVLGGLLPGIHLAATAQEARGLHDQRYLSPTWGYLVRWYGDEWEITEETSENGSDSLWLADAVGNVVGFEGMADYGGNAALCLNDLIASVKAIEGVADIETVRDEQFNLESHSDPFWSWTLLLARIPGDAGLVDHVVYLDCRTLAADQAVLARFLAGPTATFLASWDHFDILQATLPHSALNLSDSLYASASRFFDQACGAFPRPGPTVLDATGAEQLLISIADGQPADIFAPLSAEWARVLLIENIGATPYAFDPAALVLVTSLDDETEIRTPIDAIWDDTAGGDPRSLASGERAVLTLTVPAAAELPPVERHGHGTRLMYQPANPGDGEAEVESFGVPGGCGGGSRPRLRISR